MKTATRRFSYMLWDDETGPLPVLIDDDGPRAYVDGPTLGRMAGALLANADMSLRKIVSLREARASALALLALPYVSFEGETGDDPDGPIFFDVTDSLGELQECDANGDQW